MKTITIAPPQKKDVDNNQISSEEIQESIHPYDHEANLSDGSEFLDDAIRMKDQPLGEETVNENE